MNGDALLPTGSFCKPKSQIADRPQLVQDLPCLVDFFFSSYMYCLMKVTFLFNCWLQLAKCIEVGLPELIILIVLSQVGSLPKQPIVHQLNFH